MNLELIIKQHFQIPLGCHFSYFENLQYEGETYYERLEVYKSELLNYEINHIKFDGNIKLGFIDKKLLSVWLYFDYDKITEISNIIGVVTVSEGKVNVPSPYLISSIEVLYFWEDQNYIILIGSELNKGFLYYSQKSVSVHYVNNKNSEIESFKIKNK